VTLNGRGKRIPLFCMHPSGGHITAYLRLARLLGADQPLHALQSRGLDNPEAEHRTLAAMANEYASLIDRVSGGSPCRLLGWSMGGLVAHAVAGELERRGTIVELVAMVDVIDAGRAALADSVYVAVTAIVHEVQPALVLDHAQRRALRARHLPAASEDLHAWCEAQGLLPAGRMTAAAFDVALRLFLRHFEMICDHTPGVVQAPMLHWRTGALPSARDWAKFTTGGLVEKIIGGDHFSIMRPPHLDVIARDLLMRDR
jgi:thioesterase domain-containing protein